MEEAPRMVAELVDGLQAVREEIAELRKSVDSQERTLADVLEAIEAATNDKPPE